MVIIFWLVFVIIIIAVFMANTETIVRNFNIFKTRLTAPSGTTEAELPDDETITEPIHEPPAVVTVGPSSNQTLTQPPPVEQETPVQTTQPQTQTQTPQTQTQTPPPVQTRERAIYFTQIDRDGQILHTRIIRRIPVSDSPMTDALNVMLIGPSAEELNRGILNLIPRNTRILSATIRGSTAYISFSEDFLFNTFGVEGYVAQLRQIVWTVTEFPNINDVQILIEGRVHNYLGEGIFIGGPISRQSF